MLSADQLLDTLLERAVSVTETETVSVTDVLGRVLAAPQTSAITVPPLDNSAMDGYAVRVADVPVAGVRLPISQRILAGTFGMPLQPGTAARMRMLGGFLEVVSEKGKGTRIDVYLPLERNQEA